MPSNNSKYTGLIAILLSNCQGSSGTRIPVVGRLASYYIYDNILSVTY